MNNFTKLLFMSFCLDHIKLTITFLGLLLMVSINGNAQSSNDPLYDINMNNYRIVAYMNQK